MERARSNILKANEVRLGVNVRVGVAPIKESNQNVQTIFCICAV